MADAKNVYAAVAARLAEAKRTAEAVAIFEKIVKLDREDIDARKALAGLFRGVGNDRWRPWTSSTRSPTSAPKKASSTPPWPS